MNSRTALAASGAVWVAVVVVVEVADGFATGGIVVVMAMAAAPLILFAAAYNASTRFRDTVRGIDPRMVVAAQLWRVVGAAFLFGWAADDLPADFAIPAGVGDIATGVAAAAVLAALLHGTLSRRRLWIFTALGIGDFATAILMGAVLNQPDRLDELPWVLFPTLAVPFFGILHALALIQLTGDRLHPRRPTERTPATAANQLLDPSALEIESIHAARTR